MTNGDDSAFQRTQQAGEALHALAEAELVIESIDDINPSTAARLARIRRRALDDPNPGR